MKTGQKVITIIFSMLFLAACKDKYLPAIKELEEEILVVEGYIDGADETVITLSRVNGMGQETSGNRYVSEAVVQIEDDNGNVYPLFNTSKGDYKGQYILNANLKYRIKIKTKNQKEYASHFVPYKVSPPIDAITYRIESDGARMMVSTHDNTGQSKYYRWKYVETWQFRSYYMTDFQYSPQRQEVIDIIDSIYNCWQSEESEEILLNNSTNLREDIMKDVPLVFIKNGSEKLSYKYSIKVKQFVMDSVGYAFFRLLKRNTEETGSIFDPQPGNLKGNVENINDPRELVVGYIGAGSSSVKREFFTIPWNYRQDCSELIIVPNRKDSLNHYFAGGGYWPVAEDVGQWIAASLRCVDCRTRGTNVKPDFWP
jgi:hypothetical protein